MTDKQKEHLEAGGAVVVLVLLLLWLLRSSGASAGQSLNANDPVGQSTQPNNFIVSTLSVPPLQVSVQNINYPVTLQGAQNFPLYLDIPQTDFYLAATPENCDCGTGNNCPVSPYTINTINKMQALGVDYANAMIQAANNTEEAIIQNYANAGQNVYYVNNGVGQ